MSAYEVLTVDELAEEWKITRRAVLELCRSGRLRAFKVGSGTRSLWRITRSAVLEYSEGLVAS